MYVIVNGFLFGFNVQIKRQYIKLQKKKKKKMTAYNLRLSLDFHLSLMNVPTSLVWSLNIIKYYISLNTITDINKVIFLYKFRDIFRILDTRVSQ